MLLTLLIEFADVIGMIGVVFVLVAYYFLNTDKLSPESLVYQLLNLFGAIFILFSLFFTWNTASVVIEAAWIVISLIGVYRYLRRRRTKS